MNRLFMIGGLVLAAVIGLMIVFKPGKPPITNPNTTTPTTSTTNSPTITQGTVPLPQETDIIRTFFNLIEERKINDAVMMMSDSITKNDSQKQAWGVQLNVFKSVKVLDVTSSMPEEWKDNLHTYKVTLDVVMDPASANQPIPYYGYENGKNIRWITLKKSGTLWKVTGIATGP